MANAPSVKTKDSHIDKQLSKKIDTCQIKEPFSNTHYNFQFLIGPTSSRWQTVAVLDFLNVVCLLLFYAIATVFQLYHGSDMIYEMID